MSKPEEHLSYWRMWRQGWVIMWNGFFIVAMLLVLPYMIAIRERGTYPVWLEAFLDLAGLAYVVFGLPVLVWMIQRGRLRKSAAYRDALVPESGCPHSDDE